MSVWYLARIRKIHCLKAASSTRTVIEGDPRLLSASTIRAFHSVTMPDRTHSDPSAERQRIVIYILRRDVRFTDNPIFHYTSKIHKNGAKSDGTIQPDNATGIQSNVTHLLPIYVFPANQVEISGFLASSDQRSPYDEARSQVARV